VVPQIGAGRRRGDRDGGSEQLEAEGKADVKAEVVREGAEAKSVDRGDEKADGEAEIVSALR
jgi:hypothetical protein